MIMILLLLLLLLLLPLQPLLLLPLSGAGAAGRGGPGRRAPPEAAGYDAYELRFMPYVRTVCLNCMCMLCVYSLCYTSYMFPEAAAAARGRGLRVLGALAVAARRAGVCGRISLR